MSRRDELPLYTRSPGGQLVATKSGSAAAQLTGLDAHGDVSWFASTNGTVNATAAYDPFGIPTKTGTGTALGYQADVTDPVSGTVDMGARWYDPTTGQFGARDTVFGQLKTPLSLNRYTYAQDDPINRFDPDGHSSCGFSPGGVVDCLSKIGSGSGIGSWVGSRHAPDWNDVKSWGKSAWKTVNATWHAAWSALKTGARTVGNAVSACADSATCRTVAVAAAFVAVTVATGGLGDAALITAIGGGIGGAHGVLTCHGDALCIAQSTLAGAVGGLTFGTTLAAFGATGLAPTMFAGGVSGFFADATSQWMSRGTVNWAQAFKAGLFGAGTAGALHLTLGAVGLNPARASKGAGEPVPEGDVSAELQQLSGGPSDAAPESLADVGSIRNVNPRSLGEPGAESGVPNRFENCAQCAVATDRTLAGTPTVAEPSLATSPAWIEDQLGGRFGPATTAESIENEIANGGSGARGIVLGYADKWNYGHAFNVVNQDGTVRFLDGQIGGAADLRPWDSFHLLRTS